MLVIGGDVGASKTELGLFEAPPGGRPPTLRDHERHETQEVGGLAPLVLRFLEAKKVDAGDVGAVVFGVAGPVTERRATPTNIPWVVDADEVAEATRIRKTHLVNDLVATAEGIAVLAPDMVDALASGHAEPRGGEALVAPGTGLGMAAMPWVDGRRVPVPSEGGHADFAPRDEREFALWRALQARFGHVSVERVVSGAGLVNIWEHLRESGQGEADPDVERAVQAGRGAGSAIGRAALERRCARSVLAVEVFGGAFGAAAGNFALGAKATGGVFLAGGVTRHLLDALRSGPFLEAFRSKGRMEGLLARIPVRAVVDPLVALRGAGRVAARKAAGPGP